MHLWVRRFRAFAAAAALLVALQPAAADDGSTANAGGIDWSDWTPSITLGVGIMSSDVSSSIFGGFAAQPAFDFNPIAEPNSATDIYGRANGDYCDSRKNLFEIRDTQTSFRCVFDLTESKSFTIASAVVPIGLELKGPVLPNLPGGGRLFFQGGFGFPQKSIKEYAVVRGGKRGDPLRDILKVTELATYTTGESKGLWWAGAGLAFTVPFGEYDITVKPSMNYYGDILKHTVTHFEKIREFPIETVNPITGGVLKRFRTVHRDTTTFHAVAPGLGFDVELGRRGPIAVGVYINALVALFLSDRAISFSQISQPIPGRPTLGIPNSALLSEFDPRVFDHLGNVRLPPFGPGQPNQAAVEGVPGRGEVRQVYDRYSIVAHGGIMFTWVGDRD